MASASSVANTATIGTSLLADVELLGIDLRVHFETIERRFFGRVGAGGAAKTERELHPVDVAIVGEVDAELGSWRGCWWGAGRRCARTSRRHRTGPARASGRRLPGHHDRQMRLAIDEIAQRDAVWSFRIEDVGLTLRCFGLADIREGERVTRERSGEHAERKSRKILLQRREPRLASRLRQRRGRRRIHQQIVAAESRSGDAGFLRRNFVLLQVLVGKLDEQLELDWDEVVAAHLPRAARRGEGFDGREFLVPAKRLSSRGKNRGRLTRLSSGLLRDHPGRRDESGRQQSHGGTVCEYAHALTTP